MVECAGKVGLAPPALGTGGVTDTETGGVRGSDIMIKNECSQIKCSLIDLLLSRLLFDIPMSFLSSSFHSVLF